MFTLINRMVGSAVLGLVLMGLQVNYCAAQEGRQSKPKAATVCKVLDRPARYRSEWLIINATVLSDGMHATLLKDGSCPKWGLPIAIDPSGNEDESIAKLRQYIMNTGKPGSSGKTITGAFYGRLLYHGSLKSIAFEIHSIQNLKLQTSQPQ
jgi:hypothetical protein